MSNSRNCTFLFLFSIVLLSTSCASSQKSETHLVRKLILQNLHYRRPPFVGARLNAEKLEDDYESVPKPNENLDCEPLKSLFSGMDLATIRQCLASVNGEEGTQQIAFNLVRDTTPYFELVDEDETPYCFEQALKIIRVPREIYFQAVEDDHLSCFNSRIPIVPEETLGVKDFLNFVQMKVTFPLPLLPTNDEETILVLGTWIMAPFFNSDSVIESKVVPKSLCEKCFAGKGLFQQSEILPPFWP